MSADARTFLTHMHRLAVQAAPDATLLTTCEKGYGKRTNFGPNGPFAAELPPAADDAEVAEPAEPIEEPAEEEEGDEGSSATRYRTRP